MTQAAVPAVATPSAPAAAEPARLPTGALDPIAAGKAAQAAMAEETAKLDAETQAATEPGEPKDGKTERGADGKFKPKDGKAAAETKPDKPADKAKAEPAPDKTSGPNGLAKAHRLLAEGKVEEWAELVTGNREGTIPVKAFVALDKRIKEAKSKEAEVQTLARTVVEKFDRGVTSQQMYDSGKRTEAMLKLSGAKDLIELQKILVGEFHQAQPSPAVPKELADELQSMRDKLARFEAKDAEQTSVQQRENDRRFVATQLADSEDTELAKLSGKVAFQDAVIAQVQKYWDGRASIPLAEAAELAREQIAAERRKIAEMYDEDADVAASVHAERERGAKSAVAGSAPNAGKPAKAVAPNRKNAAEAGPEKPPYPPGDIRLAHWYAKQAEEAARAEAALGG